MAVTAPALKTLILAPAVRSKAMKGEDLQTPASTITRERRGTSALALNVKPFTRGKSRRAPKTQFSGTKARNDHDGGRVGGYI